MAKPLHGASCKTPFSGNQNGIGWSTNTNRSANPVLFCKFLLVAAFEQFRSTIENQIEAFVAFGLFMESERLWAQGESNQPTEATYRRYHQIYLTHHETERYKQSATQVLSDLANEAIDGRRSLSWQTRSISTELLHRLVTLSSGGGVL